MMAWTDRHCRFFHRLLTTRARLYTEMVTTGALLHGDVARHLDFDTVEQPLALQLGGSEPDDLAACARLGERWGYAEINLNCGCPSERVQRGAFGACLMAEPALVADCVRAMRDAVALPVTVKHRIGIDRIESYAFVRDFVGTHAGGCGVFIVHAQRLAARRQRRKTARCHRCATGRRRAKRDFPALGFVLNGGVRTADEIAAHRRPRRRDGRPCRIPRSPDLIRWEESASMPRSAPTRDGVETAMVEYMERLVVRGEPW
jgi:tRNA-dihydrouridine synthase A